MASALAHLWELQSVTRSPTTTAAANASSLREGGIVCTAAMVITPAREMSSNARTAEEFHCDSVDALSGTN